MSNGEVPHPAGAFAYHVESYTGQFLAVATYTGEYGQAPRTITIDEEWKIQEHYAIPPQRPDPRSERSQERPPHWACQ